MSQVLICGKWVTCIAACLACGISIISLSVRALSIADVWVYYAGQDCKAVLVRLQHQEAGERGKNPSPHRSIVLV